MAPWASRFEPRTAIFALFVASGATGLVYEVLWSRYLGLVLGHAAQAHAVVLAVFMGGLALGNALFGQLGDRTERPLRLYGWLELGVAGLAVASPLLLEGLTRAYLAIAPGLSPGLQLAAKLAVAAIALLPAATMMGGTLPVLVRYTARELASLREAVAGLYFVNSAGAVVGALLTAFWLIPAFGLDVPLWGAAAVNVAIGLGAIALDRRPVPDGWAGAGAPEPPPAAGAANVPRALLYLAVFAGGFVAMTWETAWIRLLSLVLGSSTYSFAVMLAAFITGIALGALIVRRWDEPGHDALRQFGLAEAGAGLAVLLTLPLYAYLPWLFHGIVTWFPRTEAAFYGFEAVKAAFCLALMLVPTVLVGMTLPLASRAATRALGEAGTQVGRIYAANTLGNVLGATIGGLVLLPWLGLRGAIEVGVAIALAVGALALTWRHPVPVRAAGMLGAALVVVAGRALQPAWDMAALGAGVYRWRSVEAAATLADYQAGFKGQVPQLLIDDGLATVAVYDEAGVRRLKVNGKTDASTSPADMRTQLLLGHLPAFLAPIAQRALIVGLGSGVTAGALLAHPLARLDVVEISPGVAAGARLFGAWNRHALDDPRLRLLVDDAFHALAVGDARYDVIVSEPSNPWMAGVANLFTTEFYDLAKRRLAPGGVVVQWLHTYELDDQAFALAARTFAGSFAHVALWQGGQGGDLLLVGAEQAPALTAAAIEARFAIPAVRADLGRAAIAGPATLLSLHMLPDAALRALAGAGGETELNRTHRPRLEVRAPVAFFLGAAANAPYRLDARLDGQAWLDAGAPRSSDARSGGGARPASDKGLALPAYVRERGRPLDPDEWADVVAHHRDALLFAAVRTPGEAYLQAARRAFPGDRRLRKTAAALLAVRNQTAGALALYAALRREDPSDPTPLAPLARLYAGAGRTAEALGAIDALATGADAATRLAAWREGVRIADRAGHKPRAVGYLRQILAQEPGDADARRILAAVEDRGPAGR